MIEINETLPGERIAAKVVQRLEFAEGTVDPQARIDRREISADRVDELAARLSTDEFIVKIDPTSIPCACMDCRFQLNGQHVKGAKAAAGSFTITMADALTTQSYLREGQKAPQHHRNVLKSLAEEYEIGGHEADNKAKPYDSGCGAQDKSDAHDAGAPSILEFITRKSGPIFRFMNSIGVKTSNTQESAIVSRAQQLRDSEYITTGAEISAATKQIGGSKSVKTLTGEHKGVVAAILTVPGERYDMDAILKEFGPEYQVFEVEAWAIANGAKATALTSEEAEAKNIAGIVFNLAAAGVIAGPGMRVVVR